MSHIGFRTHASPLSRYYHADCYKCHPSRGWKWPGNALNSEMTAKQLEIMLSTAQQNKDTIHETTEETTNNESTTTEQSH